LKILLIQPAKSPRTIGGEDVFLYEPLALEYLGAAVGQEHDVRILDMRLDKNLDKALNDLRPDLVGITAYTVHVNVVKTLSERVKGWNPAALIVVGGHHATVMPGDFTSPSIDLVVVGEGVVPFREIVRRFQKHESLEGIAGTVIARGGKGIVTTPDGQIDLDAIPFPDRTLTSMYRSNYYSEWMKPLASIRTSKGCPYRCTFCAEWKVARGRYYRRKPEHIVEELAGIAEECVFFADDESLVDVNRMMSLADRILEARIRKRFFLYGRSDTIVRHPELIEAWRKIGLERVFIGLEFLKDDDLAAIRKGSRTADNEKALQILRDLDIQVYASFILKPESMPADFQALRSFCRRMKLEFASWGVLTPLPGTDLYDEMKERLITHDCEFFDFIHTVLPTALPLREFYAEYRRLFKHAVPLYRQIAQLRRYAVREIPGLLRTGREFYRRLGEAHLDYGEAG
jgi:radical SAM superfamily enzyme YgiQ (UPF0313 family)